MEQIPRDTKFDKYSFLDNDPVLEKRILGILPEINIEGLKNLVNQEFYGIHRRFYPEYREDTNTFHTVAGSGNPDYGSIWIKGEATPEKLPWLIREMRVMRLLNQQDTIKPVPNVPIVLGYSYDERHSILSVVTLDMPGIPLYQAGTYTCHDLMGILDNIAQQLAISMIWLTANQKLIQEHEIIPDKVDKGKRLEMKVTARLGKDCATQNPYELPMLEALMDLYYGVRDESRAIFGMDFIGLNDRHHQNILVRKKDVTLLDLENLEYLAPEQTIGLLLASLMTDSSFLYLWKVQHLEGKPIEKRELIFRGSEALHRFCKSFWNELYGTAKAYGVRLANPEGKFERFVENTYRAILEATPEIIGLKYDRFQKQSEGRKKTKLMEHSEWASGFFDQHAGYNDPMICNAVRTLEKYRANTPYFERMSMYQSLFRMTRVHWGIQFRRDPWG